MNEFNVPGVSYLKKSAGRLKQMETSIQSKTNRFSVNGKRVENILFK